MVMRKGVAPLTYVLFFSLCVLSLSSAEIDTVNSTVQRVAYDGSSDPDNKDVSVHQVTYGGKKYPDIVVSQIVGIDTSVKAYAKKNNLTRQLRFSLQHRLAFDLFPSVQVSLTQYLNKMIDHRVHSRFDRAMEIGTRSLGNILAHKDKTSPRIVRDVLHEMGRLFLSTNRLSAARDMFLNALEIQPYNTSILTHLSKTFFMQNKLKRSLPHLFKALFYDAENYETRLFAARVLTYAGNGQDGDYEKALKILAEGLDMNPEEACLLGGISLFERLSKDEYKELDLLLLKNGRYRKTRKNASLYDEVQRVQNSKDLVPLASFATYIYEKMGHTYQRLYDYIAQARKMTSQSSNEKKLKKDEDDNDETQNQKDVHLMVYFPGEMRNRYNETSINSEGDVEYLKYNSLRTLLDNFLNPNIHRIHVLTSNSTWVEILKSLAHYTKRSEAYFEDKLNMKEMNRKPTYKDFFHLSNIIVGEEYPANEESSDLSDKNGPAFIITMKDVQFDLTVNRLNLSAKDQKSSSNSRSVNVLLPWDTNHMVTNSKGVRSRRVTSEKDDDNVNEYGGEPTLKLNGFDFVGFAFKAPLVPSIIFSEEANIQVGDFLSARAICKLFANHGYAVKSPSLSLHAHRVYGEELKINPGRLFDTIEGSATDISGVDTFGFVTA